MIFHVKLLMIHVGTLILCMLFFFVVCWLFSKLTISKNSFSVSRQQNLLLSNQSEPFSFHHLFLSWKCCLLIMSAIHFRNNFLAGPHSAVGNVSGYRCVSDCRSRGREFDPGLVPYFRGDWSWNDFYGHSPPFRWFIQEGLLSVASESMCTNYWLTACSSLPRKKCG